jgi:vanillate O-demethylase monooxygenase subunit
MQQKNIEAHPERKLKILSIDAGGVMSRRVIERLLAEERNT